MSYNNRRVTLFHGTSPRKLKSILRRGLVPSDRFIGQDVPYSDELEKGDKVIWLSKFSEKARQYGPVVLRVEVDPKNLTMSDLRPYEDRERESYLHWVKIPPKDIRVVEK